MPNQNQPDPNQNQQTTNGNSIPFSPQADLPPLPPEFQNVGANTTMPSTTPAEESGSAAPVAPSFSGITPSPKKKFGTGKIIATILGILLIAGGVGVGTYLVGQKQIFQQKAGYCEDECSVNADCPTGYRCLKDASGCPKCVGPTAPPPVKTPTPTDGGGGGPVTRSWPPNGAACTSTGGNPGTIGGCITYFCPNDCSGGCGESNPGYYSENYDSCSGADAALGNYCGQVDTIDQNGAYCIPNNSASYKDAKIQCGNGCIKPPPRTNPPTAPPPTLTPTPSPQAPYCAAITTYDSDWNVLASTDLSSLTAGTNVNFCVTGSAVSGAFDMARFIINGVQQADTTTKKPGSEAFCQTYSIPSNTTTFTVSGQIHHSTLGWF